MSALDALLEERSKQKEKGAKKPRLVADPSISAQSIATCLRSYMEYKNSRDLWALVSPPPGGPIQYNWHTPVSGVWLSKCMGLLYDLLLVAPNTKLASQKVTRALYSLYEERALDMAVRSGTVLTPADCIDKIDTGIRTLLCFIRQLKQDTKLYTKLARSMSAGDIMKLDACLEKVQLPEGLVASSSGFLEEDVDDSSASPPSSSSNPFPVAELSMVPYQAPKHQKPEPPMARKWPALPNIFLKILGNKQPERDEEATPEVAARVSDQELLQNAMAYAPSHAKFPKAKNAKKATSSKKTITKKPSQKVVAKGKPKANSSSEALQLQGDDIHGNDTMPEDVNVYTFESSVYGHCKCEIYSMKSYIRCKDISAGKWKSVLGSCAPNHGAICRKLVPHVLAGKSVQELYSIRASLMEELG